MVIPLPKKGNIRICQNDITISVISHISKVTLPRGLLQNFDEDIVEVSNAPYKAFASVILKGEEKACSTFETTVGVGQGCRLSPTRFDIFLENNITQETLDVFASTLKTINGSVRHNPFSFRK